MADSVTEWVGEIRKVWTRGTASTLDLARVVAMAKSRLRHGQWKQIWKSLPFSRRKADMLAAIGQKFATLEEEDLARLPTGWSTLYYLAQTKPATFRRLLEAGTIHPGLTLREARELVTQLNDERNAGRSKRVNVQQRLQKLGEFIESTLNGWSAQERRLAQTRFHQFLRQIEAAKSLFAPSVFPSDLNRTHAAECHPLSSGTKSLNPQCSTKRPL